jgi:hypothetical protein
MQSPAGLALLLAAVAAGACGDSGGPARPSAVSVKVSPHVATVLEVSWSTAGPTIGYVEYGPTSSLGSRTAIETAPVREHKVLVLGLRGDTEYFYRVATWEDTMSGSAAGASPIAKVRTGPLPTGVPNLTKTGSGHTGFIVTPLLGGTRAAVILDSDGEIVWYHCIAKNAEGQPDCAAPEVPGEERLEAYRARISRDGKSVLYNYAKISGEPSQSSALVRVSLDGAEVSSIAVPLLAHDFVEHADGTLATLTFEDRTFEGMRFRGNQIVEIAPDGARRTAWTSWNCFDPAVIKGDDLMLGWTFANALDLDLAGDAYYVSLRNFSSIAKIDRATGACQWVLGVGASTFTFAEGSARFLHQHQFHIRGNRILVMDNDGMGGQKSRLMEYELDFTAMQARQIWSYLPTPSVYAFVLGEPIRLADGGVFVNWSAAGQMEHLDKDGAQIWKLNSGVGTVFGFNTLAGDLYAAGGGTVAALTAGGEGQANR